MKPAHLNGSRRNAAIRKITSCHTIPQQIRITISAIINLLNNKTDYQLAWPSASHIAKTVGRSERSIKYHLRVISKLGIFKIKKFRTKEEAITYSQRVYNFTPNIQQCIHRPPNFYEPDYNHPLWALSHKMPQKTLDEMAANCQTMLERPTSQSPSRPLVSAGADMPETRKTYPINRARTVHTVAPLNGAHSSTQIGGKRKEEAGASSFLLPDSSDELVHTTSSKPSEGPHPPVVSPPTAGGWGPSDGLSYLTPEAEYFYSEVERELSDWQIYMKESIGSVSLINRVKQEFYESLPLETTGVDLAFAIKELRGINNLSWSFLLISSVKKNQGFFERIMNHLTPAPYTQEISLDPEPIQQYTPVETNSALRVERIEDTDPELDRFLVLLRGEN